MSAVFTTLGLETADILLSFNSGGPFTYGSVILGLNAFTPGRTTVQFDLGQPSVGTYPGYAPFPTDGIPYTQAHAPDDFFTATADSVSFDLSGGGSGTIYGWAYYDQGSDIVICSDTFATPIPIASLPAGIFSMVFNLGLRDVQYP